MNNMSFINTATNTDTVDVINDGNNRDILRALPGSYDDFVNSMAECMDQDADLRSMILDLIRLRSGANSSDVLKALCGFYGFDKPLELVDDDEEEYYSSANAGGLRKVAY